MTRVIGYFVLAALTLGSAPALAKDLGNRLGIGYRNQFANDLPSIAAQYYPSREFGLAAVLGVDTAKGASKFGAMVKAMRIVFEETNLNFYMGAGAGILSTEQPAGTNNSGFELDALGGVEFFFQGLENLGLSFETGVGISSISNETRFRTIGDSPIRAGMTFYF